MHFSSASCWCQFSLRRKKATTAATATAMTTTRNSNLHRRAALVRFIADFVVLSLQAMLIFMQRKRMDGRTLAEIEYANNFELY